MREKPKGLISVRMLVLWDWLGNLPLLLCLTGLFQWDVCYSQRLVQIQEGPLYRVKGYPISISCNVSGFKGPLEQDFEFRVTQAKNPAIDINMISTSDSSFAYAMFSTRVHNKDIEINRLSGSSVLLKIKTLLESDAGVFICHTPNTDGTFYGIYGAETTVNVIEDTLEASYSGSASLSMSVGDSLQLECQVSTQTFQHTHLSVTWFLHEKKEDVNPRPIITLHRDLTVKPGAGFEDRYHSGLISMDKVQDITYRLKMPQVQLSDRGKFYCKAIEWIQDPDRSWTQIAHKTTTPCNVEIIQIEVNPDVGSFIAYIEASKGPLQEGDPLEIRCSVKAQNLPGNFFSVTWLKDQKKVAQIGSSGVLSVFDDYKERENEAELRAVKTSHMDYLLTIHSARADDQGQYQCEVWQENGNDDGTFRKIQTQMSSQKTVNITAKESDLAVVMVMEKVVVTEGDSLQVTCTVSGFKGPLSVSWQHRKDSADYFNDVISLTHDGVMEVGTRYQSRDIQTFRSPAGNFTLEIGAAIISDGGEYKCIVSEWTLQKNGELKKAEIQSQQKSISVTSVDSLIRVTLKSRVTNAAIGLPIELICTVRGPKVPLAIRWMFQPSNSSTRSNILSIHHTGEITWGAEQTNYQLSMQIQPSGTSFALRVLRVSKQQEGQYVCQADAYQKDIQKASKNSNPLAVTVKKPVSRLTLSRPRSLLETTVNTDVKIECAVTKATTNTSRFKITWLVGSQMLLTMDLDAVVKFGPAAGLEMDQRIRMDIRKKQTFLLTIHQIRATDSGQYNCDVEEWLQDPLGDWYSLQKMSVSTELVVKEQENDFKMNRTNAQLNVTEGEQLTLNCSVDGVGTDSTLRYSLTWFLTRNQSSNVSLLTYGYDGCLKYNNYDLELKRRHHFSSPEIGVFHLTISRSIQEDSGRYFCQVRQYQLDCKGQWSYKSSDISGFTDVGVHPLVSRLTLSRPRSLLETTVNTDVKIECAVTKATTNTSRFKITWLVGSQMLLTMDLDAVVKFGPAAGLEMDQRIRMDIRKKQTFLLTIHQIRTTDSGQYNCDVEEWLQDPLGDWYSLQKMSVSTELVVKEQENYFKMNKTNAQLNVTEGEQLTLNCSVDGVGTDSTLRYSLTWFLNRNQFSNVSLLAYGYDGCLKYSNDDLELKQRHHFFSPEIGVFHLTIPRSNQEDSGCYFCQVHQFQLDCKGQWLYKSSDISGFTDVGVHPLGDTEKQTDPLGTALGFTIPLICFLVLVIIVLLRREHKINSDLKKKKDCLWAENNPLNPVAGGATAGGDPS